MAVLVESGSAGHGSAYPQDGIWSAQVVGAAGSRVKVGPSSYGVEIDVSEFPKQYLRKAIVHVKEVKNRATGETKNLGRYVAVGGEGFQFSGFPGEVDQGMTMKYEIYLPDNTFEADSDVKNGLTGKWGLSDLMERFEISKEKAERLLRRQGEVEEPVEVALGRLKGTYEESSEHIGDSGAVSGSDSSDGSERTAGFPQSVGVSNEQVAGAALLVLGGVYLWLRS